MIPPQLVNHLREPLQKNWLFLNAETRIVFTCGGSNGAKPSARQKVLSYAEKQFPEFIFFRAEDAFAHLKTSKNDDLLTLEIRLLEYADCVMIILESVGAIAELGAFSANDVVAKSILLINDVKYQHERSFLQLGPVAKVGLNSNFKPPIYTDLAQILHSAAEIGNRLSLIPRERRKRVMYQSLLDIASLNPKVRILLLLDILAIFSPVTREELQRIWIDTVGNSEKFDSDVAMLIALRFVAVESEHLVRRPVKPAYFFSFYRKTFDQVRSRVLLYYFRKDRRRAELLEAAMGRQI